MIEIPEDPVQVWINRVHTFALTLMDENLIISGGMRTHPNEIMAIGILYEDHENQAAIDRSWKKYVARQLSQVSESLICTHKRLLPWLASQLIKQLRRETSRPASKR